MEGLKAEFPSAELHFVEGTQFLSKDASPLPAALLTTGGKPGVTTSYRVVDAMAIMGTGPLPAPLATRVDPNIGVPAGPTPPEVVGKKSVIVQSEATLTPTESGDYKLGIRGENFYRASLDSKVVTMNYMSNGIGTTLGKVHLERGKSYALKVEYPLAEGTSTAPQLVWAKVDMKPSAEAIAAARNADVVVAVVGITSELEGEEMPVSEEGFKGGDRTSLDLPKPEQDLLEAMAATGKPLVVVLMNGSALSVNWAKDHANAIVEAWYSGEEGGAAVAETLSGRNNPAGRLPVTFTGVAQLPAFEDYSMKNRTYRYFGGTPLYPFGYGLSYTTLAYTGLKVPAAPVAPGNGVEAAVTVANTGKVAGDEVVQLYLTFPKTPGAPLKALRGFQRVHLEPGASQEVTFALRPRDLGMVTEAGEPVVPQGDFMVSVGGGQPGSEPQPVSAIFHVASSLSLPE